MNKLIASTIAAALLAGTALQAQSLALPKSDAQNFSFSVAPTFIRATLKTDYGNGSSNAYGPTVAFAWHIDRNHALNADIGVLFGTASESGVDEKDTIVPFLLSYNLSLPFGENDQFAVRVAPTLGLIYESSKLSAKGYSVSDSDTFPAYGIGLGFTSHINKRLFLDFAYRFLKTGTASMFGMDGKFDIHSFTAAIGFKF